VFTRRILLLLDVLCLAGTLWSAALVAGLLLGHRPFGTGLAAGVAALLILPGLLAGLVANRTTFRGRRPRDGHIGTVWRPPVDLPRWALGIAGVLILAFWVAGMTAFAGIDQDADMGSAAGSAYAQRIVLGVLGAFGVAGTTLAAEGAVLARRSREPARSGA
jgi:hypothetical protein